MFFISRTIPYNLLKIPAKTKHRHKKPRKIPLQTLSKASKQQLVEKLDRKKQK
jgi:hypothetical protein